MEHHKADTRPVAGRAASGDDAARFLRELRQLRDGAGLDHAELAARAHYPYETIRAAEVGPSLPDLPVLSAFVRACAGTTEEWEERWRSLTKSPSLPVSGARQSGLSDAANAGARINSATQAGDGPDPSIIIAALNRVAEEMGTPGADVPTPAVAQSAPAPPPPFPFPGDEPRAGSKSAGWDPIRVSSAWPALKHTPTASQPARDAAVGGAGVPWDAVPRPENPAAAASSASLGTVGPGASPAAAAGAAAWATAGRDGTGRSSRVTLAVAAVVLLCVAAALLAIFA